LEEYRYTYTADSEIESITSQNSLPLLPQAKNASTANAANRINQFGAANYSFDNLGQTTSKTDAGGTTTYHWDARGRMTGASLPNGQSVNYGYDALGRRASRTANGSTTSFLYDGADVVLDKANDGSTVDYLNGGGIDNKLCQTSSTSPTSPAYFLQDHLGSTIALTDASGGVTERQQYEPCGSSSGSSSTRYGYTGREMDEATGLMYYRARWYDPQQSRFISEDPIGGMNRYAYVGNNPISRIDPMGTSWSTLVDGLKDGGIEGFWEGVKYGVLFAAISALAAGTGGAAVLTALGYFMGAAAAAMLLKQIYELIATKMCDDELHYRIGYLIGSVVGALLGGIVGGAAGVRLFAPRGSNSTLGMNGGAGKGESGGNSIVNKLDEARVARDDLAGKVGKTPKDRPATVTAGYNVETGEVAARGSGKGCCAEDYVVEALGGDPSKVRLTEATRPRNQPPPFSEVPVCSRCEAKYGREIFPPGTKFKSDGE
jgi:RHS repeat-associated protein